MPLQLIARGRMISVESGPWNISVDTKNAALQHAALQHLVLWATKGLYQARGDLDAADGGLAPPFGPDDRESVGEFSSLGLNSRG